MIESFIVKDVNKPHLSQVASIPVFADSHEFTFKEGLNIIIGKNGCGKSTLLNLLADLLHCYQIGYQAVTKTSMNKLYHYPDSSPEVIEQTYSLKHDGSPVTYVNPHRMFGTVCNGAGWDDDFHMEGVRATTFRGSSGQNTIFRLESLLHDNQVKNTPIWKIERLSREIIDNKKFKVWGINNELKQHDQIDTILNGSGKRKSNTILMDEPDADLDIPMQRAVWDLIWHLSKTNQVIVTSHSLFALKYINYASYIEMSTGYLRECINNTTPSNLFGSPNFDFSRDKIDELLSTREKVHRPKF